MELQLAPQTPHPRPKRALALRSVGGVVTPLPDGEVMLGREGGGLSLGVMSPLVSRQQALLVRDGAGGLRVISRGRVNPTCLIRSGTVLRLAQGESAEVSPATRSCCGRPRRAGAGRLVSDDEAFTLGLEVASLTYTEDGKRLAVRWRGGGATCVEVVGRAWAIRDVGATSDEARVARALGLAGALSKASAAPRAGVDAAVAAFLDAGSPRAPEAAEEEDDDDSVGDFDDDPCATSALVAEELESETEDSPYEASGDEEGGDDQRSSAAPKAETRGAKFVKRLLVGAATKRASVSSVRWDGDSLSGVVSRGARQVIVTLEVRAAGDAVVLRASCRGTKGRASWGAGVGLADSIPALQLLRVAAKTPDDVARVQDVAADAAKLAPQAVADAAISTAAPATASLLVDAAAVEKLALPAAIASVVRTEQQPKPAPPKKVVCFKLASPVFYDAARGVVFGRVVRKPGETGESYLSSTDVAFAAARDGEGVRLDPTRSWSEDDSEWNQPLLTPAALAFSKLATEAVEIDALRSGLLALPDVRAAAIDLAFSPATSGSGLDKALPRLLAEATSAAASPGSSYVRDLDAVVIDATAPNDDPAIVAQEERAAKTVAAHFQVAEEKFHEKEREVKYTRENWVNGEDCGCEPEPYGRGECPCGDWDCYGDCENEREIECNCAVDENPMPDAVEFVGERLEETVGVLLERAESLPANVREALLVGVAGGLVEAHVRYRRTKIIKPAAPGAGLARRVGDRGRRLLDGAEKLSHCMDYVDFALEVAHHEAAPDDALPAVRKAAIAAVEAWLTRASPPSAGTLDRAALRAIAAEDAGAGAAAAAKRGLDAVAEAKLWDRWPVVARVALELDRGETVAARGGAAALLAHDVKAGAAAVRAGIADGWLSADRSQPLGGVLAGAPETFVDCVAVLRPDLAVALCLASLDGVRARKRAARVLIAHGSDDALLAFVRDEVARPQGAMVSFVVEAADVGISFTNESGSTYRYSSYGSSEKGLKVTTATARDATAAGVCSGMRVVSIGGDDVAGLKTEDARAKLKAAPRPMELGRESRPRLAARKLALRLRPPGPPRRWPSAAALDRGLAAWGAAAPLLPELGGEVLASLRRRRARRAPWRREGRAPRRAEHLPSRGAGLRRRAAPKPETLHEVVVVGSTGAGKSSLLNALVGEAEVLPTNCMRACTASVVALECLYAAPRGAPYEVEVAFLSRDEWAAALAPLAAHREQHGAEIPPADSAAGAARAAAVATHGADAAWPAPLEHDRLGTMICFGAKDADELRDKLDPYVDSANDASALQLWPLVRRVTVRGPWACLGGLRLVNAPGVLDDNEARSRAVRGALATADTVLFASNVRRAVNDKSISDALPLSLRRDLAASGALGAVALVATQNDLVNRSEIVESLRLPEATSRLDAATARAAFSRARAAETFWEGVPWRELPALARTDARAPPDDEPDPKRARLTLAEGRGRPAALLVEDSNGAPARAVTKKPASRLPARVAAAVAAPPPADKPLKGFMLFSKEMRPKVKREFPGLSFGELGAKLGELWRGLDPAAKASYTAGTVPATAQAPPPAPAPAPRPAARRPPPRPISEDDDIIDLT
ncbi:hypothetical protein JL721_7275 [Aureococcus anophagefferens]|nr:hypothetical protein JL721_7275 [Aureococcus anophagefferens]